MTVAAGNVVVDTREPKELREALVLQGARTSTLPVGDFLLQDPAGTTVAIIERKTFADLASSITDGRWESQRSRLLETQSGIYLIEGTEHQRLESEKRFPTPGILRAAEESLALRRIPVVRTQNTADTIAVILRLASKVLRMSGDASKRTGKPKREKSASGVMAQQLGAVTGVSADTANRLATEYPTMRTLVQHLEANGPLALQDFPKTKGKLGKAISQRLYEIIIGREF